MACHGERKKRKGGQAARFFPNQRKSARAYDSKRKRMRRTAMSPFVSIFEPEAEAGDVSVRQYGENRTCDCKLGRNARAARRCGNGQRNKRVREDRWQALSA